MGTRNLTCVFHDGKMKIAQYGQWDGYPSGNGLGILEFLRKEMDFSRLVAGMNLIKTPDEKDSETIQADPNWTNKYPQLSRNMGAEILEFTQNQTEPWFLSSEFDFGYDGLFCEWAYVVNLDAMTLEVYEGFQKNQIPETDRWHNGKNRNGYYPIKKIKEYRIGQLPTEEEFLAELEPKSEEGDGE